MNDSTFGVFPLHPLGYVRHWLVAGPCSIPYTGTIKDDDTYRRDAIDSTRVNPPGPAELHGKAPFGQSWRFHNPGLNYFVEYSDFWPAPTLVDLYAYTEIESNRDGNEVARFWVAGIADLWMNDSHLVQFHVPRYMHPDFQLITLPLRRGSNRLCLRLQVAAIRDTRLLFGLQILDSPPMTVRVPGAAALIEPLRWLEGVKADGIDGVVCEFPTPLAAKVIFSDDQSLEWPQGKSISFGAVRPFRFDVIIESEGQNLVRHFEVPPNRVGLPTGHPGDIRAAHLDYIASARDVEFVPGVHYCQMPFLTRRLLGRISERDALSFATMIQYINARRDCSDFALATLLRQVRLGLSTSEESAEIKRTALNFRYWHDELGCDAMCFGSENHSLLFHGCQFMAGQMYPDEIFSNSGRTGREQAFLGLRRTRAWLEATEANGFSEFLSSTYTPITVGALLNVVDFSDDVEMSSRASNLVDRLYEDLADHAFQGLTVGPQGRVYRNVLFPEEGGTQTLLSWAMPEEALPDFSSRDGQSKERTGDWIAFLATSNNYRPPVGLTERMGRPVSRRYPQAGVEIVLHKTPDHILTSLAVPRSDAKSGSRPGGSGYQEHLWQATLGAECHIFVNHPGCSFDVDKLSRPGYWYGNGVLPVVRQREGILQTIFNIPDGTKHAQPLSEEGTIDLHPIGFTHAYWPVDTFEQQKSQDHWVFGCRGTGFVGLWCSERLESQDDILTGRELRASGYRSAWVVICGGLSENESFEAFIESCLARTPEFDRDRLVLLMKGEEPLRWP